MDGADTPTVSITAGDVREEDTSNTRRGGGGDGTMGGGCGRKGVSVGK